MSNTLRLNIKRLIVLLTLCVATALALTFAIDHFTAPDPSSRPIRAAYDVHPQDPTVFAPQTVIGRSMPAITDAPFVSAVEADGKIDDAELVLGVVVNDQARAYPINMLTGPQREIINDVLGGRAIAATW